MSKYKIAILAGDGIGPEITEEAIKVEDLCNHVGLSRSRIFQLFDEYVGRCSRR